MKTFRKRSRIRLFPAILFCLALGIIFNYFGYERIEIKGIRDLKGTVTIDFTQNHLWGLMKESRQFNNITYVALSVSGASVDRSKEVSLSSSPVLFIMTEEGMVDLFEGTREVEYEIKYDLSVRIRYLLNVEEETEFEKVIDISNNLAWLGMPLLVLGMMGLIGWLGLLLHLRV